MKEKKEIKDRDNMLTNALETIKKMDYGVYKINKKDVHIVKDINKLIEWQEANKKGVRLITTNKEHFINIYDISEGDKVVRNMTFY